MVIWIRSCVGGSSPNFSLGLMLKVQPNVTSLPEQQFYPPVLPSGHCCITLFLGPSSPDDVNCLGSTSFPPWDRASYLSCSWLCPQPPAHVTQICQTDEFVESLKHWNKLWLAYQFGESQTFYAIRTRLADFIPAGSLRSWRCCPHVWTIATTSEKFCLPLVSARSRSVNPCRVHFLLPRKQPSVWLSSSLTSVPVSHLLPYGPLIQSSQNTPPVSLQSLLFPASKPLPTWFPLPAWR